MLTYMRVFGPIGSYRVGKFPLMRFFMQNLKRQLSLLILTTLLTSILWHPSARATQTPCGTPPSTGLVGWWRGEGKADGSVGGDNGGLGGGMGFMNGGVGQAFVG